MPFCSHRCRRIDLERWLDEQYGLACERADESEEPPGREPGPNAGP